MTLMMVRVDETVLMKVDTSRFHPDLKQRDDQAHKKGSMLLPWGKKKHGHDRKNKTGVIHYGERKKDRQKRERELAKISKDSEQYSIISSFLSIQNLRYAQGYNERHNTR